MSQIQSGNNQSEEGYQEVQIGPEKLEIPEDWTVTTVSDVASRFISGGTPDSGNEDYWGGDIPWTTAAVVEGPQFEGEKDFITQEGLEDSSASLVPEGSILFGTRVNVANVGRTRKEIAISQDLTGIILDESKVDPDFATWFLLLNQSKIRDRYSQGSTIQGMLTDDLKSLPLLSPPLPQQRRIADILSTVDEQIQQTDEIFQETKSLRDSLLQDVFGDLNSKSDQKKVQLGPFQIQIPDYWETVYLNDLNQDGYPICYGVVQPGEHDESGIPLLNIEDVDDTGQIQRESIHKISADLHEQYSRSQLQGGEVLVSVKGTVGNIIHLDEEIGEANISRDLARITPTTDLDARWLKYCLSTKIYQDLIDVFSTGSTRASLNIGELRKIPIICPPVSEQERISEILSTVESEIEIERRTKQHLQNLKRGLMQDLLTGKVRVDPD